MGYPSKIVTCCYCGTRAALVLKGKERHELACSSCGAPLHDLKMLKPLRKQDSELVGRARVAAPQREVRKKRKPKKKRKGLFSKVMEEAFDVIEDIFD